MVTRIFQNIIYFFNLTFDLNVLWIVLPLAIATIVMLFYFEKYREEKIGWNSYVANSLVLLFVSIILFRYIYNINNAGVINYVNFPIKFFVSFIVLLIGIIILFLNFEHFLPEKIARQVSSPLTLNLVAYISILYVYSQVIGGWSIFFSLLILFILLIVILNLIRIPLQKLFIHLEKMKEEDKIEEIISEKKTIKEKKEQIRKVEKQVREQKKGVVAEERKIVENMLKKFDMKKKEAIKLKKIVKK